MSWYRMKDAAPNGVIEVHPAEAEAWNKRGFGIFWTLNTFAGPRRIENLLRIEAWAIDMDEGTKAEQRARIHRGLEPSRIVETKRGYQVYFRAKDATPNTWNAIMLERLVPFYGADPKARDIARILRVPGFLHMKDPADPFLVKEVYTSSRAYTEAVMLAFLSPKRKPAPKRNPVPAVISEDEAKRAERASRYLSRIPGAVSGQGGHDATFKAALLLVKGFALSEGAALGLLRDFNQRCEPQWSEKELAHKVKSAAAARVPMGFKLGAHV